MAQREAIQDRGFQLCEVAADAFIGIPVDQSHFELTMFSPVEESWKHGDHTVVCAAYDPDQQTVGSLRGSRR